MLLQIDVLTLKTMNINTILQQDFEKKKARPIRIRSLKRKREKFEPAKWFLPAQSDRFQCFEC